jgi:hypothetical protein
LAIFNAPEHLQQSNNFGTRRETLQVLFACVHYVHHELHGKCMGDIDYQETLSWPSENGVVPYPVGRVNSQESPPSAGFTTTARAYLSM